MWHFISTALTLEIQRVLNTTSYFPASGRDKDVSNFQGPHEFNCNLLAALLGLFGMGGGGQWGYCVVQLIWVWGFFALFLSLRYTNISETSASLFTV